MRSRNLTAAEREHLGRVKALPCSLCGAPGPSAAHHIKQNRQYTCVALCYECHQGDAGWHGTKALWRVAKMDELDALDVTIRALFRNR